MASIDSQMKFCRSDKDLLVAFPTMMAILSHPIRERPFDEIGGLNSSVLHFEYVVRYQLKREPNVTDPADGEAAIDYLDMQYGITDAGSAHIATQWLALTVFLHAFKKPYPRRLIATFEKFHTIWDVDAFLLDFPYPKEPRYPTYVSDYIRQLTQDGLRLIAEADPDDAY